VSPPLATDPPDVKRRLVHRQDFVTVPGPRLTLAILLACSPASSVHEPSRSPQAVALTGTTPGVPSDDDAFAAFRGRPARLPTLSPGAPCPFSGAVEQLDAALLHL
jgi:hypothetical protein